MDFPSQNAHRTVLLGGLTLLLSPYGCSHGFQDGFLEVCSVDVVLSVELGCLQFPILTPACDSGSDDGIPPLCLEDADDIVRLEYLFLGYHGFLSTRCVC
jgi:hypothetical protein